MPASTSTANEHEGVGDAGRWSLDDCPALKEHVADNTRYADAEVIEGKRVSTGGNQADARRDLDRERTDTPEKQQPEDESRHLPPTIIYSGFLSAATIAGTISNRSPTMP